MTQPDVGQPIGSLSVENDIGRGDQSQKRFLLLLQVEHYRTFVGIQVLMGARGFGIVDACELRLERPNAVAVGRFDQDNFGAEIGQNTARKGGRSISQVKYADAAKCVAHSNVLIAVSS